MARKSNELTADEAVAKTVAVIESAEILFAAAVQQKVLSGLTREQAEAVVRAQAAHDLTLKSTPTPLL